MTLLTVTELAAMLRYTGKRPDISALKWLKRNDVRRVKRGRSWLVRVTDVEAALDRTATGDTVARARMARHA